MKIREIAIFGMLGGLMFASKIAMQAFPNIHLLGMFIVTFTVVYRAKALFPIYVYVFLDGLFGGFNLWWLPYIYIWTVLWGVTMLLPKNMPKKVAPIVYMLICALHGLCFGALYAPMQALLYGFSFKQMLAWIAAGLPYDVIHAVSNFAFGTLIVPLAKLLKLLEKTHN